MNLVKSHLVNCLVWFVLGWMCGHESTVVENSSSNGFAGGVFQSGGFGVAATHRCHRGPPGIPENGTLLLSVKISA